MKRIASIVSMGALFALGACKHKDNAPAPAASASAAAPLSSSAPLPHAENAAPSSSEFEGEVGLLASGKMSGSEAAPLALTLRVKGGKLRVDLPESFTKARDLGPGYLLVLPADKKAYAILDAKKQAVLLDLDKLAEQAKAATTRARPGAGAANANAPAPHLEKTGKFDTVAGTKCEIWRYNQGKNAGEACIAEQGTPWFQFPAAPQMPAEISWISEIADGKHLPLRFVAIEKNVEQGRVEVTSIDQKALPATLFDVPSDYAVLNLEQMMASMLGGLGGAGLPPGLKLPPGVKLPPGIKLPPAITPPKDK
jgi:hypothetical protein